MSAATIRSERGYEWAPLLIGIAILFLYSSVIVGLLGQWWADDNYSHGLLVPFLIALIVWQERDGLKEQLGYPQLAFGSLIILFGLLMLLTGTLGAELFTQRVSLVFVIAGTVVYFAGQRILGYLSIPFLLLLLAIPIPTIVLNKAAFPLQLLATKAAQAGISLFGITSERKGNVIELLPLGETKYVALEVVEACSGIRSLVTLVTLAVILTYFTRTGGGTSAAVHPALYRNRDIWRGVILVGLSIPIALMTNAARVLITGLATYGYGGGVAESWWHDAFGWITFLAALALLFAANIALGKFLSNGSNDATRAVSSPRPTNQWKGNSIASVVTLFVFLLVGGAVINWFQIRTETPVDRLPLEEFPVNLGNAYRPSPDTRFSPATEDVLKATDYVMRDYISPPRRFNLYIGYYATQRTGSTYHSPQNCLPGSGWEMTDGSTIEITSPAGRRIFANRYVVRNGNRRHMMIYWYQGRGRTNSSEYWDKLYTVVDSVTKGRSDGSMIRVMTPVYPIDTDEVALGAATELSGLVADALTAYVPE